MRILSVFNAGADTDRFLVQDGTGAVKFRTGAEVAADIGAANIAASQLKHTVKAAVALTKGQAVYVSGADGTNMLVSKASNATESMSTKTMGLIDRNLAINDMGDVITEGLLAGLDTSTATIGDPVWLGVDGNLIYGLANKPLSPAHLVFIGIVTRVQTNNGEIFVKVQNGFELGELHDVLITGTPVDKAVIQYDSASGLWKNSTLGGVTASTGTAGQVAYFTGATTQAGNNNLFWDITNGRLGIGTNTPSGNLDVRGSANPQIRVSDGTISTKMQSVTSLAAYIGTESNHQLRLITNNSPQITIHAAGNVHVGGTSDAGQRLQVTGTTLLSDTLRVNGNIGVGVAPATDLTLYLNKSLSGSVFPCAIYNSGLIPSTATAAVSYFQSVASTQNLTFTLPNLYHYRAVQATLGASSTVSNQFGFIVDSSLIGATNNYGFYGDIASGTGRWNLYMNGTANNYMAGSLGIGSTTLTGINLRLSKTITGATSSYGILNDGVIQPDVTSIAAYNRVVMSKAAGVATSIVVGYWAVQGTYSGTVDTQYGYLVDSTLTGATNNYAYFSNIASGTGRWNLYMNGTAANFLSGDTLIGSSTISAGNEKLQVTGTARISTDLGIGMSPSAVSNNNSINIAGTNGTFYRAYTGATETFRIQTTSTTNIIQSFSGNLRFDAGAVSNAMTLFSTGNLVVASTGDTGEKLQVTGTAKITGATSFGNTVTFNGSAIFNSGAVIRADNGTAAAPSYTFDSDLNTGIYRVSNDVIGFTTGGTEKMRLDASGNLGLGVTPSAWSSFKALQLGGSTYNAVAASNDYMLVSANAFFDGGGFKYISNAASSRYLQNGGAHYFEVASSGTAGNAITFTQAMTLDAIGRLGIGTTAINSNLVVYSTITDAPSTTNKGAFQIAFSTTNGLSFGTYSTSPFANYIQSISHAQGSANYYPLSLQPVSGNVLIGSTSDSGERLQVTGTAKITGASTFGSTITIARGQDANVTNVNINSGVTPVSAFQLNTDQPNTRSILMARNGYSLVLGTQDANRLTIDTSGNLGLAVTPSAWGGPFKVMQLGTYGQYIAGQTNNADMKIGMNSYYNGTNYIYTNSGSVTLRYDFSANGYAWQIAPSGTAGNAITFTQAMTLTANSRLLLNQTSDTGEQLQVTGTAKITGVLSLGSNLSVVNGFTINSAGSNNIIGAQTTQGAAILSISNIYASSRLTAGTQSTLDITNTFNPTSGPALHHFLNLTFTVNQTGGANGITRGIYLNATLTAAADFRGIEWTNNTGWGLYGAGSASNYLQGSLGIGTASINASAKLQIDSTTQGFLPPRMTSTQRSAISSPSVGLVVYQTDGVEGLYIYTNTNGWKSLAIVN